MTAANTAKPAAAHLVYPVKMTGELYAWTIYLNDVGPATLKNTCLEATLVHVRLLIEFLAGRPINRSGERTWKSKTDIVPSDFLSDWKPHGNHLDGYLELIDKYVVHLSHQRADLMTGRTWALTRMVDAILIEFANFTDAVERAGSPFGAQFRAALAEVLATKNHQLTY